MLFLDLIVQFVHKAHGAGRADIGQNELLLQLVIEVIVNLRMGQRVDNVLEKPVRVFFQTALDLLLLLKFFLGNIAFEEVEKAHGGPPFFSLLSVFTACVGAVSGNQVRADLVKVKAQYLGNAVLLHRDAVQDVRRLHRTAAVGDDDELGGSVMRRRYCA